LAVVLSGEHILLEKMPFIDRGVEEVRVPLQKSLLYDGPLGTHDAMEVP